MKKAKRVTPTGQNFVTVSTSEKDVETFITPSSDDVITIVTDGATMEEILVAFGKFASKSQARKNGWAGPVPEGFNAWQIGKEQFVTLNMKDDVNEE